MSEATFTGTVDTSGNYTVDLTLSEGVWNVIAIQTLNGERSEDSDELEITIDTTDPEIRNSIPPVTVVLNRTFTVRNVSQYFNDLTTLSYAASSDATGIATATVTSGNLDIRGVGVGSTEVEITATDVAGNDTTREVEVTVIPPMLAVPTLNDSSNSGSKDDNITNRTNLTFNGSNALSGAVVTVTATRAGQPSVSGQGTVDTSRGYTVDLTLRRDGEWLVTAVQTLNGESSEPSGELEITIDTTDPEIIRSI